MKELGLVILTCSFLSSAELAGKNVKVLIALERSWRKHKAFYSWVQKIIYKVTIDICSRIFTKNVPGWARRSQLEAMGRIVIWDLFVREMFMANRWGKSETVTNFIFLGSKITVDGDCSHKIKRYLLLQRKIMTNLDNILKKQRHHFADKGLYSQSCGFSSSHVWMWELDHKEAFFQDPLQDHVLHIISCVLVWF